MQEANETLELESSIKKTKPDYLTTNVDSVSVTQGVVNMPTAVELADERAHTRAIEDELRAWLNEDETSKSTDEQALSDAQRVRELSVALKTLQMNTAPSVAPPDAAALVQRLNATLKVPDDHFLNEYHRLFDIDTNMKTITDELMHGIEQAIWSDAAACSAGADGVALAAWLAAAAIWREPRVSAATRALHCVLLHFTQPQVEELGRALVESLISTHELMAVSDILRGSESAADDLSQLLLRATLCRLLGTEMLWDAGALGVTELEEALVGHWVTLDAAAQLAGARLAGRVLATAAARGVAGTQEAAQRLAALAQVPPPDRQQRSEYIKVAVTLTQLEMLFR